MRILVTGANGFVGQALVPLLHGRGNAVRALLRRPLMLADAEVRIVGDLGTVADWRPHLDGIDAVVHLAARVHQAGPQDEDAYRRDNVDVPLTLAAAASAHGVRRFVFLSSVKAMAEESGDRPLTEDMPETPADAYGRSKRAAERGLLDLADAAGLEPVCLRPPLVYGPGVKANFLSLMKLVDKGVPLPLGGVRNRRSLIAVGNLADAITCAATHPAAVPGVYLVADQPSLSTSDLIRAIAASLGRPARLLPVPHRLLTAGSRLPLPALAGLLRRLSGSLDIDDSLFRRCFGWAPPQTLGEALTGTAAWFRSRGPRFQ